MNIVGKSLGRYKILAKLGEGGMASVYRAQDTRIGREVAVKILPHYSRENRSHLERFIREVRLLADISHPSIVGIFDFGQSGELVYYVMEYLPGGSLADLLRTRGKIEPQVCCKLAREVTSALECIHQLGVLHRDIKPHNLLISQDGDFKLADFGLGKASEFDTLTRTGEMIGTLKYLPPEGLEGQPMDQTGDLFQLGLVLYEACTGQRAYRGGTAIEIVRSYHRDTPAAINELNPQYNEAFNNLVHNLIQIEREDRYSSAPAVLADLARIEKGLPVRRRLPVKREEKERQREAELAKEVPAKLPFPKHLIGAGVGAFFLLLLLLVGFRSGQRVEGGIHAVKVVGGSRRVSVSWTSQAPYRGRVEFRPRDSKVVAIVEEEKPTLEHFALLSELEEGVEYLVRVKEEGNDSAVEQIVKTSPLSLELLRATANVGSGEIAWSTSQPVECQLELSRLGRTEFIQVPGGYRTSHTVRYSGIGRSMDFKFKLLAKNVVKESVEIDLNDAASKNASNFVSSIDSDDFNGICGKMVGYNRMGSTSKIVLGSLLKNCHFFGPFERFTRLGSYYLGNPANSLDERMKLAEKIRTLEAVNRFCELNKIDVKLPVDGILPEELTSTDNPKIKPQLKVKVHLKEDLVLAVRGAQLDALDRIVKVRGLGKESKGKLPFEILQDLSDATRAEIRITGGFAPSVMVKLQINGRGPLRILSSRGSNPPSYATRFPPSLLQNGLNHLLLELEPIPGAEAEGLQTGKVKEILILVESKEFGSDQAERPVVELIEKLP